MRNPAPAENPTITEWETKLTMNPSRNRPNASWRTPTITAIKLAATIKSGEPGVATSASVDNNNKEIVLVGPEWS